MAKMKRAKNGWFLETEDGVIVYQEPINDSSFEVDEVERFADFLRAINMEFGPSTSRYSPKRIHILVEPGDKYEGEGT
ncbi:MAG: hypothetical protein FJ146_07460 [Deltaproteobacteria bacterium]|nr:hypothetical protein [Deltaproteobacteria bacterium]